MPQDKRFWRKWEEKILSSQTNWHKSLPAYKRSLTLDYMLRKNFGLSRSSRVIN